jgi:hypothetical protein
MISRRILTIISHKICEDGILYRVQWNTHDFEWASGPNLDLTESSPYLLRYWETGGQKVVDAATQTDFCRFFELPETSEELERATREFIAFPADASLEVDDLELPSSRIPVSIVEIDVRRRVALVKFTIDGETTEMELRELRDFAPKMIAEYYLAQVHT